MGGEEEIKDRVEGLKEELRTIGKNVAEESCATSSQGPCSKEAGAVDLHFGLKTW